MMLAARSPASDRLLITATESPVDRFVTVIALGSRVLPDDVSRATRTPNTVGSDPLESGTVSVRSDVPPGGTANVSRATTDTVNSVRSSSNSVRRTVGTDSLPLARSERGTLRFR